MPLLLPASVLVNDNPDMVIDVDDAILCSGESATIRASGASAYNWADGRNMHSEN